MSDQVDSFKGLICDSFGFDEEVFERIKSCGLDEESLVLITDEDVNELFPISMLGIRVKFKERLAHWRRNEADTVSASSRISNWLNRSSTQSSTDITLREILAGCQKGTWITNSFEEHGHLNDDQRIALVSMITDFYRDRNIRMSMKEIILLFPNENVDYYYYNRGKGKNPTGKLHDRAVNDRIKIKIKTVNCAPGPSNPAILDTMESASDLDNEHQIWLQHNCDPWEDVIQRWKITFKQRQRDVRNAEKNIFVNWPLFKNSLGFTLVEIDFDMMFPEKNNNLLKNWGEFRQNIVPFFKEKIKDTTLKKLMSELENELSLDSQDYIIVLLLHGIIKPPVIPVKCEKSDACGSHLCVMHRRAPYYIAPLLMITKGNTDS